MEFRRFIILIPFGKHLIALLAFSLLSIWCPASFSQLPQALPQDPAAPSQEDRALTEAVSKKFAEASKLYYSAKRPEEREAAKAIWASLLKIDPTESQLTTAQFLLLAALNTGDFKKAGELLKKTEFSNWQAGAFDPSKMSSVDWNSAQGRLAVRFLEKKLGDKGGVFIGSGVVVSDDGWILTAAHVIAAGSDIIVQTNDGSGYPIKRVCPGDFKSDLALVKIDRTFIDFSQLAASEPKKGSQIKALGFPKGCVVPVSSRGTLNDFSAGPGYSFFETDLSILLGSSGSGVFDEQGKLIGIVSRGDLYRTKDLSKITKSQIVPWSQVSELVKNRSTFENYPLSEANDWEEKSPFWAKRNYLATIKYNEAVSLMSSDPQRCITMLKESSEEDNPDAPFAIAMMYRYGIGVPENAKLAFEHFEKASEYNHPAALVGLGNMYLSGIGVPIDREKGLELMEKASEAGSSLADRYLCALYMSGKGVPLNREKAEKYGKRAAEAGDNLGANYYIASLTASAVGFGSGVSLVEAGDRIKKGGDQIFENIPKEKAAEIFKWSRILAQRQQGFGHFMTGLCYGSGVGTEKDLSKAFENIELAGDAGYKEAYPVLASLYHSGGEFPRNLVRAKDWASRAAANGDMGSKMIFVSCEIEMENPQGRLPSFSPQAIQYLNDGSQANLPWAQLTLGRAYLDGCGIPKDPKKALALFEKAKANGNGEAAAFIPSAKFEIKD